MGEGAESANEAAELGFGAGMYANRSEARKAIGQDWHRDRDQGGDRGQPERWRCLSKGCNPVLNIDTAQAHKANTGHRVAKWPVRSAEGKRRARERNKSGYYGKYNVGHKSYEERRRYLT